MKTKTMFKSAIAAVAALAIATLGLVGCSSNEATESDSNSSTVSISIDAENWTDESTPAIAHFKSNNVVKQDFYHAFYANSENTVELENGQWTVEFVAAPINADGASYELPEPQTILVPGKSDTFEFKFIPADTITNEQLVSTLDAIKSAVLLGDDTLANDNAKAIIELAQANASNAPAANAEEIEAIAEEAQANVSEASQNADNGSSMSSSTQTNGGSDSGSKPTQSASGNTSNGGSSAPAASTPSAPAHQHSWVDITETRTVTDKAAWNEPIEGIICSCGKVFTDKGSANAHTEATGHASGGGIIDYKYHPAQTHTETVVVGQKCSSCGQTK